MLPENYFFLVHWNGILSVLEALIKFCYVVESEILKNTQWNIFHIFTSEDIDHVTFFNLLLSVKFHNLLLGLKQYFTHLLRSFVKYCFHHSKIKVVPSHSRVISSIYYNVHDLKTIFNHVRNPLKTKARASLRVTAVHRLICPHGLTFILF
jgi:hypothetical protein